MALALFGSPGSAGAAELVDVRVGTHPTFTRVVFELDAPGGYSVERQLADDGTPQLLVMMDAGSSPRSLDSKSFMVERVAVQDGVDRSLAHVRLKHKPSRLKEMILSNPPRLVFDFVYPEDVLAARKAEAERRAAAKKTAAPVAKAPAPKPAPSKTAAAPKPAPKAAPVAKTPAPAPKPAPVAPKPAPKPAPVAKTPAPAPKPAPVAKAPTPKPIQVSDSEPVKAKAEPEAPAAAPLTKPETAEQVVVDMKKGVEAKATDAAAAAEQKLANTRELVSQKRAAAEDTAKAATDEMADAADLAAKNLAAAKGKPEAPKPPATKPLASVPPAPSSSSASAEGGIDWMLVAGAGAGVLALFIGFVLWNRRRSLPNDIDVTAFADDEADADAAPQPQADEFAMGLDEAPATESVFEETTPEPAQSEPAPATPTTEIAAGPGLFDDDDSEKENDAMDIESPDLPMERTASEMPTQMNIQPPTASAAGDGDVARMMRDMEARLVKLETRLDEANDARERLERQVTAQAEELRVQRAAIARTQRALRGMSSGEEDQATEPAIRQPSS